MRYATVVTLLVLMIVVVFGAGMDLAVRYRVRDEAFLSVERTALQWSAQVRSDHVPRPIPVSDDVDLVQVVDARGRITSSSPQTGRARLSRFRPEPGDRLRRWTECPQGKRCVLLTADRISPNADSPVVYAGAVEPSILATHDLEYVIAAAAFIMTVLAGWLTWRVTGRSLRPVQRQYQLASTTSHELRNPIAGLRVQLEEALLYPDHVNPRDTIQRALSTTDRLEAIIDDLLLLARLRGGESAPHEVIDLGALVAEEARTTSHPVPVDVRVTGDVRVHGSRTQLSRLLSNLMSNARRHAESGVIVCVTSGDGLAVVAVTDDGAGIEPAYREQVFERFVRLEDGRRRDAAGSGLGLAISRDIAHAHRGTLRIEDSAHGARFVLRLPLMEGRRPPA
ncbi:sensor histidine kinase [Planotetraspora kaengkrachanensis]|uniref:sensor histidine kinase n=1 Tax=Planotetraspora kaengkrachanensis TaxID=575193 RepID=UPI001942579C|nr:HAMP domain-containing sensor histidine kinase [Planotetraspora kaengkrachanensis]